MSSFDPLLVARGRKLLYDVLNPQIAETTSEDILSAEASPKQKLIAAAGKALTELKAMMGELRSGKVYFKGRMVDVSGTLKPYTNTAVGVIAIYTEYLHDVITEIFFKEKEAIEAVDTFFKFQSATVTEGSNQKLPKAPMMNRVLSEISQGKFKEQQEEIKVFKEKSDPLPKKPASNPDHAPSEIPSCWKCVCDFLSSAWKRFTGLFCCCSCTK